MQLNCGMNIGARGFSGGTKTLHTLVPLKVYFRPWRPPHTHQWLQQMLAMVAWLEGLAAAAYIRQGEDGNCS